MSLFPAAGVLQHIRRGPGSGPGEHDIDYLINWLKSPPGYTTLRINRLKPLFDFDRLRRVLEKQGKDINAENVPEYTRLSQDVLLVRQWACEISLADTEKELVVDAQCGAAVLRGAHVYAPGVMGMPCELKLDELVRIYADVEGKCKRGLKIIFEGPKRFVGVGRVKLLRHQLFADNVQASGIAVHMIFPASKLPVINESIGDTGQLLLQNLPSIVCGWVVDPKPNERILDMCAAPGNKTTHLAEISENQSSKRLGIVIHEIDTHEKHYQMPADIYTTAYMPDILIFSKATKHVAYIVALDKTISKVAKIKEKCQEHGITSVSCYVQDSIKCFSESSMSIKDGPPFPEESFDKILLDAPCSALGQRPQLLNKITVNMLQSYKFLQRKLFSSAVKLLKYGGRIIYSTCTVTQDENEGIVVWALETFPCLQLVPAHPLHGNPGWTGCGLTEEHRIMVQRFGPEQDSKRIVKDIYKDTVGFFIACFVKK